MFLIGIRDAPAEELAGHSAATSRCVTPRTASALRRARATTRSAPPGSRRPSVRAATLGIPGSLLFNGNGRPLLLDGTAPTLPASMGGNATPIVDQRELETARSPGSSRTTDGCSTERPLKRAPAAPPPHHRRGGCALQGFPRRRGSGTGATAGSARSGTRAAEAGRRRRTAVAAAIGHRQAQRSCARGRAASSSTRRRRPHIDPAIVPAEHGRRT